jgi:hypothetical protein
MIRRANCPGASMTPDLIEELKKVDEDKAQMVDGY